jgi:predicted DNA-binding protein YlxM (UPF0122 family)
LWTDDSFKAIGGGVQRKNVSDSIGACKASYSDYFRDLACFRKQEERTETPVKKARTVSNVTDLISIKYGLHPAV